MEDLTSQTRDGRALTIRPVRMEDAAALIGAVDSVAREQRWYLRGSFRMTVADEERYIGGLDPRDAAYFVAEVDYRMAGWVIVSRDQREYARHNAELGVGVIADYRGIGVGEALMKHAIDWCRSVGVERLGLGVRASNLRAVRLYSRLGFTLEGRRNRFVKTPTGYDDELVMGLFL